MIVPAATEPPTFTTTVNVVEAPTASEPMLQEIEVAEHAQPVVPETAATETNVVFVGWVSENTTLLAAPGPGPLFVAVTV
jgi:hypothetical protein